MARFMAEDGRISGSIAKRLERRHLDIVHDRGIVGLVAAVPNDRTRIAEEAIGALDAFDRIKDPGGRGIIAVGQTVDLLDIEHRIGLQERDLPVDLVTVSIGFRLGKAAGEDDGRASLALAYGPADFEGLLERHPH